MRGALRIRPTPNIDQFIRAVVTGTGARITGRYLGLHGKATGAVPVTDRTATVVLCPSGEGDRNLLLGPVKRGGPRKVAEHPVNDLKPLLVAVQIGS